LLESISAFKKTKSKDLRFVIAGDLADDIKQKALALIDSDSRIYYLGWKSAEEIKGLLCAADVYVQPGTQSATMQMSMCARCPIILADVLSHKPFFNSNGWLVSDQTSLEKAFIEIDNGTVDLKSMSIASYNIAKKVLDYKILAKRVLR
jgi:1,2-diacylglycerol 3-alpha-glucosyltransferase